MTTTSTAPSDKGAQMRIPHGALILVADARRGILLLNRGDATVRDLQVVRHREAAANPATREQGTDKPGRVQEGVKRGAVRQTDWHDRAEAAFAAELAAEIFRDMAPDHIILVAPARFLGQLRGHLPAPVKAAVKAELVRDLTHLSVAEIEKALGADLDA